MSSSSLCEQVQYALSVRETGGDAVLSNRLERHLEACNECAAFRTGLQDLEAQVASWQAPVLPPDLKPRIAARLSAQPASPPARSPFRLRPRSANAGRRKESRNMWKRLSWEAAAVALTAVGILSLRPDSVEAIFKRMVEATKNVHTAHIILKAEGAKGNQGNAEMWYKEGRWRKEERGTTLLYLGKEVWKNGESIAPTSVPSMPATPMFFALKADNNMKITTRLLGNQRVGKQTVRRLLVEQAPKSNSGVHPPRPTVRWFLSVDTATDLLMHMEGGEIREGQFVALVTVDLDYNEKLPDSLFDPKQTEKRPGEEPSDSEPIAPPISYRRQENTPVDEGRLRIERVLGLNKVQKEQYTVLIRQATLAATAIENDTTLSPEEKEARHLADRQTSDAQLRQILTPAQRKKLDAYVRAEEKAQSTSTGGIR